MYDILPTLEDWLPLNKSVAVATVINTWGSSPRVVGSKMIISFDGEMAGSVSGGCVEAAVVAESIKVIESRESRLLHYGVTDEDAWDIGLACGGEIDIFLRPLDWNIFQALINHWKNDKPVVNVVLIQGRKELMGEEILFMEDEVVCSRQAKHFQSLVENQVLGLLDRGVPIRKSIIAQDGTELEFFFDVIAPPPTLVVVGGVHVAVPLISLANTLGYKTVVIDPRKQFGNVMRFPHANRIINEWPKQAFTKINLTSSTAVAVLTHDPKIDDSALECVLSSPIFYLGVLGSSKTQGKRRQRLLDLGFSISQVAKIKGPIGIDLGGKSPEEIALAIMAEIVKTKNKDNG